MKYGVVYYDETNNIGDDIQSYAAMRFLPQVDYFIDREKLDVFQPEENDLVCAIMNGWYMHNKCNWPPSSYFHPLYVSMHFCEYDHLGIGLSFLEGLGKEYFAKFAPIGCRDLETKQNLDRIGIENYLSGCMTLTIPRQEGPAPEQKYICLVDVPAEVEAAVRRKTAGTEYEIKTITHTVDYYRDPIAIEERFKRAKELLLTYQNASCVVTSRLHSALPCLALETPVLLIFDEEKDEVERFDVFLETLHHQTKREFLEEESTYDIVNPPANKTEYLNFRNPLIKRCEEFVQQAEGFAGSPPTKEVFTQELLEKTKWQKGLLKEAEHGFTKKSDELKAYLDELESGRQWLEGQYKNYMGLAEGYKSEAESYKSEVEKHKNEIVALSEAKSALRKNYNLLASMHVLDDVNVQEVFNFPSIEKVTEAEKKWFDFSKRPGLPPKKRTGTGEAFISIISGFYNGAGEYLEQTFNSIVSQTFPWFEWVIVNDGTTIQKDLDILEKLAAADSRIRVINQNNQGLSAARNKAIQESKTDLIMIVDTDDLIEPNMVEVAYWTMQKNPDAAWCFLDSVGFDEDEYLWRKKFSASKLKKENILVVCAIIRRSALLAVGGYRVEEQTFYEDWCMWLSLLRAGYRPVHVHQYGYWYRRKTGMLSDIIKDSRKHDFARGIIDEYAQELPDDIQIKAFPVWENAIVLGGEEKEYDNWQPQIESLAGNKNALCIITDYAAGDKSELLYTLAVQLMEKNITPVFAAITPGRLDLQQKFSRLAPDSFYLPGFLQQEEYAEFLSYIITSRKIDLIVIDELAAGLCLVDDIHNKAKEIPLITLLDTREEVQLVEKLSWKNIYIHEASRKYAGENLKSEFILEGNLAEEISRIVNGISDKKLFAENKLNLEEKLELQREYLSRWQEIWMMNFSDQVNLDLPSKADLLDDLEWNTNKVSELEKLVKTLDDNVLLGLATIEKQQGELDGLKNDVTEKQKDLEKAQSIIEEKQMVIKTAQDTIEELRKNNEEKQEFLEERQATIDKLNTSLNTLQNNFLIRMMIRLFRYKI